MGVTSYYSYGGEILGEETSGARRDYLTDALGSVTATVTGAGVVENTYRYKPYGEQLAKTGAGSDPKFLWNGKWGYLSKNEIKYVRKRHLNILLGAWTTIDLYWPIQKEYIYTDSNPVNLFDSTGFYPVPRLASDCSNCFLRAQNGTNSNVNTCISDFCKYINDHKKWRDIIDCFKKKGVPIGDSGKALICLRDWCHLGKEIHCTSPLMCEKKKKLTCNCNGKLNQVYIPRGCWESRCNPDNSPNSVSPIEICCYFWGTDIVKDCPNPLDRPVNCFPLGIIGFMHELGHMCVVCKPSPDTILTDVAKCIAAKVGSTCNLLVGV